MTKKKDPIAKNNDAPRPHPYTGVEPMPNGQPNHVPADAQKQDPTVLDMREIGATGLRRFSGFIYDEFLPELTGWKGIATYTEMSRNDATVGAILFVIKMLCRRTKWFVKPASQEAIDQEAGEFLETCMNDMSETWTDTIDEALTMLDFGYAPHELVYKRRCGDVFDPAMRSKYSDGRIGWRRVPLRSQDTIYRWQFDDHGGIQGVEQLAPPHYYHVTIPVEKMLLFRTTAVKNNPEGRSILRTAYRCFSGDTELLTGRGWLLVSDIADGDTVVTLNRETGIIEYEVPSERQEYHHSGEMIHAESRFVDQLVTPNHRMWVRKHNDEGYGFAEASECKPSYAFSAYGDWKESGLKTIDVAGETVDADTWLRFLGIWLAEGSTSESARGCGEVSLCQKEGPKAEKIRNIIAAVPWHFSEAVDKSGMIRWRHYEEPLRRTLQVFGKAKDKHIPRGILNYASKAQLQVLLDAYYLGDGTTAGDRDGYAGTKRLSTVSSQLADDMMEAALKCGHRATKRWHAAEGGFSVGCWMVTLGKQFAHGCRAAWSSGHYDGQVYCVTTRNGVVLSRRNGKASWSGNSWYMKKNIENIEAIGIERDLAGLPVALVPPEILSQNASTAEKQQLAAIKSMIINIRRNEQEAAIFPLNYDGNGKLLYELKLLSTGGQRQFNTSDVINRYDNRIAMSCLADFIMLGQQAVGSFALVQSKTNLFSTAIGAFLDIIANVWNRYAVPRLFNLNDFKVSNYPEIKHGDIGAVDLEAIGKFIQTLAQSGMPIFPNRELEEHLMEVAGLPPPVVVTDRTQVPLDGAPEGAAPAVEIPNDPRQKPTPEGINDRTPADGAPKPSQVSTNVTGDTERTSRATGQGGDQYYDERLGPKSF